jgi:hypothetical protein
MEKTTVKVATTNNNIIFPSTYTHKNIYISCAVRSEIGKKMRDELLKDGFNVLDRRSSVKIGDNLLSNIDLCSDFILIIEDYYKIHHEDNTLLIDKNMIDEFHYDFEQQKHIIPIIEESLSDLSQRRINDDKMSSYLRSTMCLTISDSFTDEDYTKLKEALVVTSISKAQAEQIERKKERKKNIDEIVSGLKTDKIEREHTRVQWWYWICIGLFFCLIVGFGFFMYWNVTSINKESGWETIIIRVLISMSFLSMIFILMNQAARSRKNLVLLSKEIQEYDYIGALLKGKVDYSTNEEETNKAIDSTFDKMIEQHLTIQKQRLEKEDHTEVKDITPDILNFFKENTSTMMGNYNEMQKNILDLHKTIVQTLKDDKEKK